MARSRKRLTEVHDVLTVTEAAKFLRMGKNQLYTAIGRLEVPYRRIGRSIRLSRSALVRWLDRAVESSGSCSAVWKG